MKHNDYVYKSSCYQYTLKNNDIKKNNSKKLKIDIKNIYEVENFLFYLNKSSNFFKFYNLFKFINKK